MIVKTIEIETSFGGVISEAPYENIKPGYRDRIVIDLTDKDNENEIRTMYRNMLQEEQIKSFQLLKNRMKAELIESQFSKIRFREKDGIKYPSVTSIIGWSKDFFISDIDLKQYGARGTIVHYMVQKFAETGTWLTLKEVAESGLREEAAIMFRGGLKLKIEDCSHETFFEQFGKDFEFEHFEVSVFNEKYLYCGRLDAIGKYKGVRSIIDFKTGKAFDMKQLAAYSMGDSIEGIEQLVICPIGPTDNKSGVMKPVTTLNISGAFDEFLKDRSEFRKQFGI